MRLKYYLLGLAVILTLIGVVVWVTNEDTDDTDDTDDSDDDSADPCLNVVCTASSPCKVAGTCVAGTCTAQTNVADDTSCDDGVATTIGDVCTAGVCAGRSVLPQDTLDTGDESTPDPCLNVVCTASTECKVAGNCVAGTCTDETNVADDTDCDGDANTSVSVCRTGVCTDLPSDWYISDSSGSCTEACSAHSLTCDPNFMKGHLLSDESTWGGAGPDGTGTGSGSGGVEPTKEDLNTILRTIPEGYTCSGFHNTSSEFAPFFNRDSSDCYSPALGENNTPIACDTKSSNHHVGRYQRICKCI